MTQEQFKIRLALELGTFPHAILILAMSETQEATCPHQWTVVYDHHGQQQTVTFVDDSSDSSGDRR